MNDFERKLSQQPFRDPPADLRAAILGAAAKVIALERWTWRDWLWPSPQAWAALAALWLVFAAVSATQPAPRSVAGTIAAPAPTASYTLLTYHASQDLAHALEISY